METNGGGSAAIKRDPAFDRVKTEGGDRVRLSSIPPAPSSGSITPKVENKPDRKPLQPALSPQVFRRKGKKRNRKWYKTAGTAFVRRGNSGDHVKARFNKQDMLVELSVRRSRNATWEPEPAAYEVFHQFEKQRLHIEPVQGWNFLDFLDDSPEELSYTPGEPHKAVPVRMIQSSLKNELKNDEQPISHACE